MDPKNLHYTKISPFRKQGYLPGKRPSSWLAVAVFLAARGKVKGVPDSVALELAARALGITVEHLRSSIEWHENYMRWHDGDFDYKVL